MISLKKASVRLRTTRFKGNQPAEENVDASFPLDTVQFQFSEKFVGNNEMIMLVTKNQFWDVALNLGWSPKDKQVFEIPSPKMLTYYFYASNPVGLTTGQCICLYKRDYAIDQDGMTRRTKAKWVIEGAPVSVHTNYYLISNYILNININSLDTENSFDIIKKLSLLNGNAVAVIS